MKPTNYHLFDFLDFDTELSRNESLWKAYKPTAVYEKEGDIYVTVPFQKQKLANDMMADTDVPQEEYTLIIRQYNIGITRLFLGFGDYVLTGGELPALVMMDAISRFVPGVLNNEESAEFDSFHDNLLEYPQYSRPEEWHGKKVPEVLMSGHHANIEKWRREQSIIRTARRRPDLLKKAGVDPASIQSFDDLYDASKTIVDGGFATYGIGFFANGAMFNVALGREGVQAYNNENGLNGQPVTECLYDSDTTVHDSIYNMLSIYREALCPLRSRLSV